MQRFLLSKRIIIFIIFAVFILITINFSCRLGKISFYKTTYWELNKLLENSTQNTHIVVNTFLNKKFDTLRKQIKCNINGEYDIKCFRESSEVYFPFSFLRKYFEVYGKLEFFKKERFLFSHSYSKVFIPKSTYNASGTYMNFESFEVEARDRVKCISAIEGVPISNQWEPKGYFYPTQIAQFGLSHYSKNIAHEKHIFTVLENGENSKNMWKPNKKGSKIKYTFSKQMNSFVLNFTGIFTLDRKMLEFSMNSNYVMLLTHLYLLENSSMIIELKSKKLNESFQIHYLHSDKLISIEVCHNTMLNFLKEFFLKNKNIFYGIGTTENWKYIVRNIVIDLRKGLALNSNQNKKIRPSDYDLIAIHLKGSGAINNLTLANSAHKDLFLFAADWFVNHQDSNGGWPINISRKLIQGYLELKSGWYSAMSQGQAISVLMRAYSITLKNIYIDTAEKALQVFKKNVSQGGICSYFMEKYPWYEEYPTNPGNFVLNGFIYSLFGLFDFISLSPRTRILDAYKLFNDGISSLKTLLPLFDTGSGSIYDLRHFTLKLPPNLARWDYHSTHVNQLFVLSTIFNDSQIKDTAIRWLGYMKGKKSPHN